MKMKLHSKILASLLSLPLLMSLSLQGQTTIISDPIDGPAQFDSDDGWGTTAWERQGSFIGSPGLNNFASSFDGLSPQAGDDFWVSYRGGSGASAQGGIKKFFPGNPLAEGTYTITFQVGRGDGWDFLDPSVYIIADVTGDESYAWGKRITEGLTAISTPTPDEGDWATWVFEYDITAATQNVGAGTPSDSFYVPVENVVGSDFGILFLRSVADNQGWAADDLNVTFVPEPGAVAALLGGVALLFVGWRRFRKS